MMIAERDAQIFNFYLNSLVREGLRYCQELYGKVYSFSSKDRDEALNLATELGEMGDQVLITVSHHSYAVWIELRSSGYPHRNVMGNATPSAVQTIQPRKSSLLTSWQEGIVGCQPALAF